MTSRLKPRLAFLIAATMTAALAGVLGSAPAQAVPAAGGPTTIGPGVQILTPLGGGSYEQCTGNFVFGNVTYTTKKVRKKNPKEHATKKWITKKVRVAHRHTYVGMAAHCVGAATNSETDTNGCSSGSLPLGTKVYFYQGVSGGSTFLGLVPITNGSNGTRIGAGVLRYSSWLAMKKARTVDGAACSYNDFALVEVAKASLKQVNPTVPFFGGPGKIAALPGVGATVYTVGNSSQRGTERSTSGTVAEHSVWSDLINQSASPGVPGDSGSGYMNASGRAVGVLSTLNCSGFLVFSSCKQNGIGSLGQEVAYARKHGFPGLKIVKGTTPFNPAGIGSSVGTSTAAPRLGLLGLL